MKSTGTFYFSISEQALFIVSKVLALQKRKQKILMCVLYIPILITFIPFLTHVYQAATVHRASMALCIMILNTVFPCLPPHPEFIQNLKKTH